MSAPIDDNGYSDPLRYAPPWARRTGGEGLGEDGATAAAPDMVSEVAPEMVPAVVESDNGEAAQIEARQSETGQREPAVAAVEGAVVAQGGTAEQDAGRERRPPESPERSPMAAEDPRVVALTADEPAPVVPQDLDDVGRNAAPHDLDAVPSRPNRVASLPKIGRVQAPSLSTLELPVTARARTGEPPIVREPARIEPPRLVDSPAMVPSDGDPGGFGWLRPRPFEGDLAMRELTKRLSLDPHLVPEPPRPDRRRVPWRGAVFLAALCGMSAAVALALVLVLFPGTSLPRAGVAATPADTQPAGPGLASTKADRALMAGLERVAPARLVLVEVRRGGRGEPVGLGVTLTRGLGEGSLLVSGLASGSRLTAGTAVAADAWRVPVADLGRTSVQPPRGFVGTMDLGLELRLADDTVADRSTMRIEWGGAVIVPVGGEAAGPAMPAPAPTVLASSASVPPASTSVAAVPPVATSLRGTTPISTRPDVAVPVVDPEEIAILLERGKAFLARGDLAAARLLLRRAAEAGESQAALLVGSTFDPAALKQLEVLGAVGDQAQARQWYQRAAELGSAEAARRLESLDRSGR